MQMPIKLFTYAVSNAYNGPDRCSKQLMFQRVKLQFNEVTWDHKTSKWQNHYLNPTHLFSPYQVPCKIKLPEVFSFGLRLLGPYWCRLKSLGADGGCWVNSLLCPDGAGWIPGCHWMAGSLQLEMAAIGSLMAMPAQITSLSLTSWTKTRDATLLPV